MENKELEKLLEKLHAELEKVDSVDEEGMQLLRGISMNCSIRPTGTPCSGVCGKPFSNLKYRIQHSPPCFQKYPPF